MTGHAQSGPRVFLSRPGVAAGGVFLFALVLTLVAQRGGVRLSFDSFYYIEYAKELRHRLPDSFGQSWPYGWPLIGSAGGLVGLRAYTALVLGAATGVLTLLVLSARLLAQEGAAPARMWLTLGTGAGSFLLTVLVSGVFSEVPFAAVLLGLAFCLTRWPQRGAIIASGILAVAALSLRYAGGLAFVLLFVWLWQDRKNLRQGGRLSFALGWVVAAALLAALLLFWNRQVTGHFSGGMPRASVPPGEWPGIAADLGWALPTALGGFFARDLLGFGTALRVPVGLLLSVLLILTGVAALYRHSRTDRVLGGLIVTYLAGLVVLRCHSEFDALHNGRMLFPVLFPLLLVAGRLPLPPAVFTTTCGLVLVLNVALCLRGASLAVGADVRAALPHLSAIDPSERILVNEHALTLSALIDVPVRRLAAPALPPRGERPPPPPARYIVMAAAPADRRGGTAGLEPADRQEIVRLLDNGYRETLTTPSLVVLQLIPDRSARP